MKCRRFLACLLAAACACLGSAESGADPGEPLAPLSVPASLDPFKARIGQLLFTDPLLSRDQKTACVSCHDLHEGGTLRQPRPKGTDGSPLLNVPTIFDVANNYLYGWRGRLKSLDQENESMLLDPGMMGSDWSSVLKRIGDSGSYSEQFIRHYGAAPTRESVLDALAEFEESLQQPDSPFDRYLNGDRQALTSLQVTGYGLFKNYGCASCHQGRNVGGNMVEQIGIFHHPKSDAGASWSESWGWKGSAPTLAERTFRVPSLRNVALTSPYFHDGRISDLQNAVSTMGRMQLGRQLSQADTEAIAAFLESLTSDGAARHQDGREQGPVQQGPVQ